MRKSVNRQAGVDRIIYGTKIVPLLKVKTATIITTIRAGTTFKSFMARRYRREEIVSVQNCTQWSVLKKAEVVPSLSQRRSGGGSPRRVRFVNVPGHRTSCVALARVAVALVAHAT
jgi:hypothetical protein